MEINSAMITNHLTYVCWIMWMGVIAKDLPPMEVLDIPSDIGGLVGFTIKNILDAIIPQIFLYFKLL